MSRRIVIEPVTRIEGHAKISIQLDHAGGVESAKFHVTEFRGFEKLCEGRPFQEMPGIMSRVCGICPVSHILASSKAGDMLLGVDIPPAAEKQRRLVNYAQILQSHALSFFHLSSPDLLLGMDAPAARRSIFGLIDGHADFLRRGIRLRQFGQRIIETVGGKRLGYPRGCYRVGPLARLNVAKFAGTPRADRELREFKQRGPGSVCASFHYHLARLIEILYCAERIEELMSDSDLFGEPIQAKASLNRREGVGSCEAPRGTLFHRYSVDPNGLVTNADLLIATAQNHQAMNLAIEQTAREFLHRDLPEDGVLNRIEAAIRCFDPCLSCSTHALGQIPIVVDIFSSGGKRLRRIARVA